MALLNKKLTDREKSALCMFVFGEITDWKTLYCIAENGPMKNPSDVDKTSVSKWKNSDKVTAYIETLNRTKYDLLKAAENKGIETGRMEQAGSVHTKTEKPERVAKFVDYSSPAAQQAKLNELVNTADDPGEALDALKVIIQAQKADRDAAREGRTVRAYLPQACTDCPLYQKARKKGQK